MKIYENKTYQDNYNSGMEGSNCSDSLLSFCVIVVKCSRFRILSAVQ